jgi:hypothetical protein
VEKTYGLPKGLWARIAKKANELWERKDERQGFGSMQGAEKNIDERLEDRNGILHHCARVALTRNCSMPSPDSKRRRTDENPLAACGWAQIKRGSMRWEQQ